uniref:Uncharacterized protein n=1 Tax=Anguilla anguilla TaxID=7936 RepID=A0A0E9T4B3_ANGAN
MLLRYSGGSSSRVCGNVTQNCSQ